MKKDLDLKFNETFHSAKFDMESSQWIFWFDDKLSVQTSGFWRVLQSGKYKLISSDHLQSQNDPANFDLTPAVNETLKDRRLEKMSISQKGDVLLSFDKDVTLEMYISSVGYETYQIYFGKAEEQCIVGIGGEVALNGKWL